MSKCGIQNAEKASGNIDWDGLIGLLKRVGAAAYDIAGEANELREIRATLLLNFGKDAKRKLPHATIRDESVSTLQMLLDVLDQMLNCQD